MDVKEVATCGGLILTVALKYKYSYSTYWGQYTIKWYDAAAVLQNQFTIIKSMKDYIVNFV